MDLRRRRRKNKFRKAFKIDNKSVGDLRKTDAPNIPKRTCVTSRKK